MNKKICAIIAIFLIITMFPSITFANEIAYDLKNGYIAVKESVFNALVTNDKLNDIYVIEIDRQKSVISNLIITYDEKDKIQTEKTNTLYEIISNDKSIITAQTENIKSYEKIFNEKNKEIKTLKSQVFLYKVIALGVGIVAISQMENNGWKIAAGAGLASFTIFEWNL